MDRTERAYLAERLRDGAYTELRWIGALRDLVGELLNQVDEAEDALDRMGSGKSVLQEWVTYLPLREQGTLLTAVRGCDLTPKLPLDGLERRLTAALRWSFMTPADEREVGIEPGAFFQSDVLVGWRASELGHLPLHWYSHVMHAAEVLAYRHPADPVRKAWIYNYVMMAEGLHLRPETREEMVRRLSEDRIATGTVVS